MTSRLPVIIALFLALISFPARADMDYRCLKDCMGAGKGSATCMPLCTYGKTEVLKRGRQLYEPVKSPHDQFTPPVPTDQIITRQHTAPESTAMDYQCISQCRQNGYQLQLCDEQCANLPFTSSGAKSMSAAKTFTPAATQPAGAAR